MDPGRRGEETWLETEARLFGAAVRTAFNRLANGLTKAARSTVATLSTDDAAAPGAAKEVQTPRRSGPHPCAWS